MCLGDCSLTAYIDLAHFFHNVRNWLGLNSFSQCLMDGHLGCLHCYNEHSFAYTFAHICKYIYRINMHFLTLRGIYYKMRINSVLYVTVPARCRIGGC